MSATPAVRHYTNHSTTAAAVSWASSERHHTIYRNHARKVARAWRREYRILERAFLPGRWQPGYWDDDTARQAA